MKDTIRDFFMYNNMDCMGWRWKKRFTVLLGLLLASPSIYGLWFSLTVMFPKFAMMGTVMGGAATHVVVGGVVGMYIGLGLAILIMMMAIGSSFVVIGISEGFKTKKW